MEEVYPSEMNDVLLNGRQIIQARDLKSGSNMMSPSSRKSNLADSNSSIFSEYETL